MPGDISCFCCRLLPFSKINFLKKSFRNTISVSNGKDPDQDRHYVGQDWPKPEAETACKDYQQTTKVAASMERVKEEKKIDKIDKYKTIFTFFNFLHSSVFPSLQIFSDLFTAHALSFKDTMRNLLTKAIG